tara:strand:+ start:691 stop:1347 length:657 start_codon:yes stop_codon:yes gene_type:complete
MAEENSEEQSKDEKPEESAAQLIALATQEAGVDLRTFGLCGDIDEEKTSDILYAMLMLKETGMTEEAIDPDDLSKGIKVTYEPFDFIISTGGGSAYEMFAIYDMMKTIKKDCTIRTIGMGKVMSAGVVLLAAGTKGERYIGENCRVMIHSVAAGYAGTLHNLETEMDEIRWCQQQYVNALAKQTKMSKTQIKRLLAKKVNVYLDAKEAIEMGIADKII